MDGRKLKMEGLENKLVQAHEKEMEVWRKRIIVGENEHKKLRVLELERMSQRYQHVKKELENQHKEDEDE